MRIGLTVLLTLIASPLQAGVIHVDDFNQLATAINTANLDAGSTILLAPGLYSGGALPFITASMTFQLDPAFNAPAGSAVLNTDPAGSKGILTVPGGTGINLTVDGLTFENAAISSALGGNAAGIRYQGAGAATLTVMNSLFLGNQDGILTGTGVSPQLEQLAVSISHSLFANNGGADGLEHGIYVFAQSLQVSDSTFCGTIGGHDIKSRAAVTSISGSFLYDGFAPSGQPQCTAGSTSYAVDTPNGGQLSVTDTLISQGDQSQNSAMLSYGEEGLLFASNSVTISGDSFLSTINGRGIQELAGGTPTCLTPVQLSDTGFSSNLTRVSPAGCEITLVSVDEPQNLAVFLAVLALMSSFLYSPRGTRPAIPLRP